MSWMVTGQWVRQDTRSCRCHRPGVLLQHTRWQTSVCARQTATCTERCSMSRQWHTQAHCRQLEILHADSHLPRLLDVADRVPYKLAVTIHHCLHSTAPKCLADCCVTAHRHRLDVAPHLRSTLVHRASSVAGPIVWNSFPDELRDDYMRTVASGDHRKHCSSTSTSVPSA